MTDTAFAVAHRTNTIANAAVFADHGFTHFELDVRLIEDDVVLSHFQPVIAAGGRLERDNARVRYRTGPPFDAAFTDVLFALPADAVLVFDPKDRRAELRTEIAAVLARTLPDPDRHVVSSRSTTDLETFASYGFRTWHTLDTPRDVQRFCASPTAGGVTVRQRALSPESIQALHEVTSTVVAWTVNDVRRARELAVAGVDGVTTDRPDMRAALRSWLA